MVSEGKCGPWTAFAAFFPSAAVKFLPHTRQRVAFSLRREPQVGQTFEFEVEDSAVIGFFWEFPLHSGKLYHILFLLLEMGIFRIENVAYLCNHQRLCYPVD